MRRRGADAGTARRARAGKRSKRTRTLSNGLAEVPPRPGEAWIASEPGAAEALARESGSPAPAPEPVPSHYGGGLLDDGLPCPLQDCERIAERDKRRCMRRRCGCQPPDEFVAELRRAFEEQRLARRWPDRAIAYRFPGDPLRWR